MQTPATYFDGQTAVPKSGTLQILGDALLFHGPSGDRRWELRQIASVDQPGGETHIAFKTANSGMPSEKLVVQDPGFAQALQQASTDCGLTELSGKLWMQRIPWLVWLLIAAVVLPAAWIVYHRGAEEGHRLISIEQEIAFGDDIHQLIMRSMVASEDKKVEADLQALVDELKPADSPYPYKVTLLCSDDMNAFAVPGGRIYVLTGFLNQCPSRASLLGVLAHEIGHVEQRHSLKQITRTMGTTFFMSNAVGGGAEQLGTLEAIAELGGLLAVLAHSRDAEREADAFAVDTLHAHQLSVGGMVSFFEKLHQEMKEKGLDKVESALQIVSTHPLSVDRMETMQDIQQDEPFEHNRAFAAPHLPADTFPMHLECPDVEASSLLP